MTRPRLPDGDDLGPILDELRKLRSQVDDMRLHPLVLPIYPNGDPPDEEQRANGAPWIDYERRAICWQMGSSVYCTNGSVIADTGAVIVEGQAGTPGAAGVSAGFTWRYTATLVEGVGADVLYVPSDCEVPLVVITVVDAPTGGPIKVQINRNGSPLFSAGARPTIASGGYIDTAVPDLITTLSAADLLSCDIDVVGTGEPGRALTVQVIAE